MLSRTVIFLILAYLVCGFAVDSSASNKLTETDYRPGYHFTPKAHWMNDPNGMVYYKGEYHLFFQYYPDGNVWGPMHWGHAVTTDFANWEELPIALFPDSLGYIFSGSAVIDKDNTSGLKSGDEDVMIAIYTYHHPEKEKAQTNDHQYQGIAYSNDKGRSWSKYDGNPVIPNVDKIKDFRDPKVQWNKESKRWIMTLAAGDEVMLYSSKDLKDWSYESSFGVGMGSHGGVWECPDLILLDVEGSSKQRWVLFVSINPGGPNGGSATQYFVGDFDGHSFTTSQKESLWIDYGTDNYAGVTWSNSPDDRTLFMGWMSNWIYATKVPTETWRSTMTLARELKLTEKDGKYNLVNYPVQEILSQEKGDIYNCKEEKAVSIKKSKKLADGSFHLHTIVDLKDSKSTSLVYGNKKEKITITYNKLSNEVVIDRSCAGYKFENLNNNIMTAPVSIDGTVIELDIWVDKTSLELFVNKGECVLTTILFPENSFNNLSIGTEGDKGVIKDLSIKEI